MFSASVVFVFMSLVLRGAKELRVDNAVCDRLTAADVENSLVNLLASSEIFLQMCLFCLFTFWRKSSWVSDFTEVCSLHHFVLPVHLPSVRALFYSALTCSCHKEL